MIEIELDGRKVEVLEGSMVMHAADKAGTYIPHFCYHKKLSIAASCRMCLVDVEKAPKPMPACATPVTQGMVVRTRSDKAVRAQKDVMEFLLINHPLDCPICDQGGECQLQDLAVGYGGDSTRYGEEKRVVMPKEAGPLISMAEMSRCIHCTRCVRFGQEVAGDMELGMIHRGEHAEITTIKGETIDSELSGNMIDLCPVGALTSKPFRYSARTWELSRRKSVSPHDSTGANLVVQVKNGRVMRVVPLENDAVNECWIADRDRFSYEALNSDARLRTPMIKQDGQWVEATWQVAMEYVARSLRQIKDEHGAQSIGALAGGHSTLEELTLLAQLVRGLGSDNIDYRLRQSDFSAAATAGSARWLGRTIASLSALDRVLVVGASLRKDHPLFAARVRASARKGARVYALNASQEDWAMPMAGHLVAAPSQWVNELAQVAAAVAAKAGVAAPLTVAVGALAQATADALFTGAEKAILLGKAAEQHPQAAQLFTLAHFIATHTGATVGVLGQYGNAVGAQWAGALPQQGGLNAAQMLGAAPAPHALRAAILLNVDPTLDAAAGAKAAATLRQTAFTVVLTAFRDEALDCADVLLPVSPYTETSGSFVNAEGLVQSFHGVVKPLAETRPAWKVLRVLGELLALDGFDADTSEAVRDALLAQRPAAERLDNQCQVAVQAAAQANGLERLAYVPIYAVDGLVRRAPALAHTADAVGAAVVTVNQATWSQLGLQSGDLVRVQQGDGRAELPAVLDKTLAAGTVRVPAGLTQTAALPQSGDAVHIEKV